MNYHGIYKNHLEIYWKLMVVYCIMFFYDVEKNGKYVKVIGP